MGRKNEADTGGGIKSNKTIRLKYNLKLIGVGTSLELTQKCELLGKARILIGRYWRYREVREERGQ